MNTVVKILINFCPQVEFRVVALLDRSPWDETADFGSKVWLVSQALRGDESNSLSNNNPYLPASEIGGDSKSNRLKNSNTAAAAHNNGEGDVDDDDDIIPEDRFHLKLPKNVDQYTGVKMEGVPVELSDEVELPEDRFHRKDASSSYLIQQRDKAKQDKWANHEK